MAEIFQVFGLEEELLCSVSDNGSDAIAAGAELSLILSLGFI